MKQRCQIIAWFLTVVILTSIFFVILPRPVLAQTIYPGCEIVESKDSIAKPIKINFSLPGITTEVKDKDTGKIIEYQVLNLPCFIIGLYTYFAGVAGILATVMIMFGGIKYVVSFGNPQKISDAKDTIFAALSGLVLMLGAYVLLNFINPNLTELKMPNIDSVKEVPDYFCDPNKATPKDTVMRGGEKKGVYQCGYKGVLNDVECVFDLCLSDVTEPGSIIAYQTCVRGTVDNPLADTYSCLDYKESCERITDSVVDTESDAACSPYSKDGIGMCVWYDAPTMTINDPDRCLWRNIIGCEDSTWAQVDCSKCNNAGKKCPKVFRPEDKEQYPVPFQTECSANATIPVYFLVKSPEAEKYPAICCEKINVGDLKCVSTPAQFDK